MVVSAAMAMTGLKLRAVKRVGKVAEIVGEKRIDQREIRAQRGLEQVALSVQVDPLLAFLDNGADACRREHAAKPAAAGADALDQRALRHEIDRHRACNHLPLRLRIEADVARDGAADQTGIDELADSPPGHGVVVGDHDEITFALAHQFVDQALGSSDAHEPSDHEGRPIRDHLDRGRARDSFHSGHF